MSLFQALSDMSKQHAENSGESGQYHYGSILDDGKIDVVFPPVEPEPAPTVSLYNLLDHSAGHLSTLHLAVQRWLKEVYDEYEPEENPFYCDLKSWNTILKDAVQEKSQRDSEAWAEKTAKEINETL